MRYGIVIVLFVAGAMPFAAGQGMPSAPEALKVFDVALGHWTGQGTVIMTAEAEPLPWTAKATLKKMVGGFAVQEDWVIDFGEMIPVPGLIRTTTVFEPHSERLVVFQVTNMSDPYYAPIHVTSDGRIISSRTFKEGGKVVVERGVTRVTKDVYDMKIERSEDGGPFFVHVQAKLKRSRDAVDVTKADKGPVAPPAEEMKLLERQLGHYSIKGKMKMAVGTDAAPMSGTETVASIMGGHAHLTTIKGDPMMPGAPGYEGLYYVAWSPHENAYISMSIGIFGDLDFAHGNFIGDDEMIYTSSLMQQGLPYVHRTSVKFEKDNSKMVITVDSMMGDTPCDRTFEATFVKKS